MLYLLVGYFAVPSIAEFELVSIVEAHTGVTSEIDELSFDPFGLRLEFVGFDLRLLEFLSADVALEEVVLVGPRVSATVDEFGQMNLLASLLLDSDERLGQLYRDRIGERVQDLADRGRDSEFGIRPDADMDRSRAWRARRTGRNRGC